MIEKLKESYGALEQRVSERTSELESIKKNLNREFLSKQVN
jgi:nitrate/nitrite-specific signal transduction histidine kinase